MVTLVNKNRFRKELLKAGLKDMDMVSVTSCDDGIAVDIYNNGSWEFFKVIKF